MRNSVILIALLFISAATFGQIDSLKSKRDFFYLYNGKAVLGNELVYSQPVLGNAQISIGDQTFPADSIMFYKDKTGFYVNTKYSTSTYTSEFAIRTVSGKYNYYVQVSSKQYNQAKESDINLSETKLKGKSYFSLGYNDPVPANTPNIYKCFEKNSAAQADVQKLRKYNRAGTALLLAGVASFGAGMLVNSFVEQDPNNTFLYKNMPAIIGGSIGTIFVATGVFVIAKSPSREEIIRKANSIY